MEIFDSQNNNTCTGKTLIAIGDFFQLPQICAVPVAILKENVAWKDYI